MTNSYFVVRCSQSKGGFATTFNARGPNGEILLVKVASGEGARAVSDLRREYQLLRRASALDARFPRPAGFTESVSALGPDCGCASGRAAILMERICGPTLRELVNAGRFLDEGLGRRVARDLLEQALVLAELGYCHHDLTPSNVMLDVWRSAARLIDLGAASRTDADDGVRLRGPFQPPGEAARPQGVPPSRAHDLHSVALVLKEACWGDLVSAGRPLPETPLSGWVGRVVSGELATLEDALAAL